MSVTFPATYGRAELALQEYVLLTEQLARVDASVALIVCAHNPLRSSHINLVGSEAAIRAASEAAQIHGGYGSTQDYPVEKYHRDVNRCTIGEGTREVQRMVTSRELLRQP